VTIQSRFLEWPTNMKSKGGAALEHLLRRLLIPIQWTQSHPQEALKKKLDWRRDQASIPQLPTYLIFEIYRKGGQTNKCSKMVHMYNNTIGYGNKERKQPSRNGTLVCTCEGGNIMKDSSPSQPIYHHSKSLLPLIQIKCWRFRQSFV
jgi:hypothetical protein